MPSELATAMADLDEAKVNELIQTGLSEGAPPLQLLDECREGMTLVGKRYEAGEYFLTELIMAGEILRAAAEQLTSQAGATSGASKGKVVVGTVKGDIHDIGKDIVITMLRGAGYEVQDLGVDVSTERFVQAVKDSSATVVGLSGLLTLSFDSMKQTVEALRTAGLPVKVMIGGGPVDETVREHVGADAGGRDALVAVALCDRWIGAEVA